MGNDKNTIIFDLCISNIFVVIGIKNYGRGIKRGTATYQTGRQLYHSKIQREIVFLHLKTHRQPHLPIIFQSQDRPRQIPRHPHRQGYSPLMTCIK